MQLTDRSWSCHRRLEAYVTLEFLGAQGAVVPVGPVVRLAALLLLSAPVYELLVVPEVTHGLVRPGTRRLCNFKTPTIKIIENY